MRIQQFLGVDVLANIGVGNKLDPFGRHLVDATLDRLLGQLHVGDAVLQQPADAIGAFVHGDLMSDLIELIGGGQARGATADDGDLFSGSRIRVAAARSSLRPKPDRRSHFQCS